MDTWVSSCPENALEKIDMPLCNPRISVMLIAERGAWLSRMFSNFWRARLLRVRSVQPSVFEDNSVGQGAGRLDRPRQGPWSSMAVVLASRALAWRHVGPKRPPKNAGKGIIVYGLCAGCDVLAQNPLLASMAFGNQTDGKTDKRVRDLNVQWLSPGFFKHFQPAVRVCPNNNGQLSSSAQALDMPA